MTTTIQHPANAPELELDMRDMLRKGGEPFPQIMAAVETLPAGHVLHLRAIFEPKPLLNLLGSRGFSHETHAHAPDDWSAWFWRAGEAVPTPPEDSVPTQTIELDVRVIAPREKHPTIFSTFDGLASGQSMVIVNDHDPRPLRYQLAAERPDSFEWTYEAQGPEVWRVRIDRK